MRRLKPTFKLLIAMPLIEFANVWRPGVTMRKGEKGLYQIREISELRATYGTNHTHNPTCRYDAICLKHTNKAHIGKQFFFYSVDILEDQNPNATYWLIPSFTISKVQITI